MRIQRQIVNTAREARGENFSILDLNHKDFQKETVNNAREARGEKISFFKPT